MSSVRPEDLVLSDMPLADLARLYARIADHIATDETTTFTDDRLLAATSKLSEAASAKVLAAAHVRGGRTDAGPRTEDGLGCAASRAGNAKPGGGEQH